MTTAKQLKKASAFIALVNLFLSFKLDEYVSTDKARELFVESGVLDKLSSDIVTSAAFVMVMLV